jgi:tRNA dimethylallyltransferase
MCSNLLVILGPTASGKTKLAAAVANELKGEIISADSRQIFKDMDIGTGKDLNEYQLDEQQIPFHLINIKEPGEKYHVNAFKEDFYIAFDDIHSRSKFAILCGGTGMYIHSILQNHELTAVPINEDLRLTIQTFTKEQLTEKLHLYPEKVRANTDYSSHKRLIRAIEVAEYLSNHHLVVADRPQINPLIIGLASDIETRRKRILDRLNFRLKNGLIEEVQGLLANGVTKEMLVFYGLEYKFVTSYLTNEIDYSTLKERLGIAICQFAKRQMTFFRKMEKDGVKINWLNTDDDRLKENVIQLVEANFK